MPRHPTRRFAGLALAVLAALPSTAQAGPPPVGLGTADPFAVLAGSTITNTGPAAITGNLGLHPGIKAMVKHGFNQLSNSSMPVDSMHFELRWRGTKKK